MEVYKQFLDPTVVKTAVACHFLAPRLPDLVVSKGTLLQVYTVVASAHGPQMKLVHQARLDGCAELLTTVRTLESPDVDYVVVHTRFAKLLVIRWDAYRFEFSTVSLHHYDSWIESATTDDVLNPLYGELVQLRTDPNSQCSCVVYRDQLVFLPFHQREAVDDDDEDMDESASKPAPPPLLADSDVPPPTVYKPSVQVEASTIDPKIAHIVDLQFLHNYKQPTVAILYHPKGETWSGMLLRAKDTASYLVVLLDLALSASTVVLSVDNLPFDTFKAVPLQAPLNGALLVGCNQLIHVDSNGSVRSIAVNAYAPESTRFRLSRNQINLDLYLEHVEFAQVAPTVVLGGLHGGRGWIAVQFELDGRAIKDVRVEVAGTELQLGKVAVDSPLCLVPVVTPGGAAVFVGNRTGTLVLMSIHKKAGAVAGGKTDDDDDDIDLDDEEEDTDPTVISAATRFVDLEFAVCDLLLNVGPITSFAPGFLLVQRYKENLPNPNFNEVCFVAGSGAGKNSTLSIIRPCVEPVINHLLRFLDVLRIWTLAPESGRHFMVTTDTTTNRLDVFDIDSLYANLGQLAFPSDELTLAVAVIGGRHILHVTPKHLRVYDGAAFAPVLQVDIPGEAFLAMVGGEFLLLTLNSGDAMVYHVDTSGEVPVLAVEKLPVILENAVITGGYVGKSALAGAVRRKMDLVSGAAGPAMVPPPSTVFLLTTGDNRILAFVPDHHNRCFQLNYAHKLSNTLRLEWFDLNSSEELDPFVKQIVVGTLGATGSSEEYLTMLTVGGEIMVYHLHVSATGDVWFTKHQDIPLTGAPDNAFPEGTHLERKLVYMENVSGVSGIFVAGGMPYWISRTLHLPVRVLRFTKLPAVSFALYVLPTVANGFVYLDHEKNARICTLDTLVDTLLGWGVRQVPIGELVKQVAYHMALHTYVVLTYKEIPYTNLDEDGVEMPGVDHSKTLDVLFQGSVRLVLPLTWTVIDLVELDANEVAMLVKLMVLDITSTKNEGMMFAPMPTAKATKELVVVGTGIYRVEDLALNGKFQILEIIDVNPDPDHPEMAHKFKEVYSEGVKGAATQVCELSGRTMVTQGQKVIVRDLQDDNNVVPVAFLDTSIFVSEAKAFGNLLMLGDSHKSVQLVGFDAEPFRMIPLGKDLQGLGVVAADFLAYDYDLQMVVADEQFRLHVLQYNPEDAHSLGGQRLIQRSTFALNSETLAMRLFPKHEAVLRDLNQGQLLLPLFMAGLVGAMDKYQAVGLLLDGLMYNVFPVLELVYRRLYVVHQQITDKEMHPLGLNPRMNRSAHEEHSLAGQSSKPILDYDLVRRLAHMNLDRRRLLVAKVGRMVALEVWRDLVECEFTLGAM